LSSERVERRLTAILAADVAGYSRLSCLDEEGTHALENTACPSTMRNDNDNEEVGMGFL
jgi:hypothetical protein